MSPRRFSDNIRHYVTVVHSSGSVSNRLIHFKGVSVGELLLKIPLGSVEPHSTIWITVAVKPRASNVDSDPYVGLSDGSDSNLFIIRDLATFQSSAPCEPQPNTCQKWANKCV